jgi:monofunctional glycosyltransferase
MPRRTRKPPRWRRWLRRAAIATLLVLAASVCLTLPLRWFDPATTAFMLADDSGRDPLLHEWVTWDELGTAAPLAVVAAEDQKFGEHFGLDVESIRSSIEKAGDGGRLRGASTISQQVAKNLYLWSGRTFVRKGLEAYFTVLLEAFLPKRRILEIYLNIAEFGPGIYGAGAASRHYFGKSPSQMSDREAALLAAVLPNPARLHVDRPSAYVRERQVWIGGQMQRLRREGWITTLD